MNVEQPRQRVRRWRRVQHQRRRFPRSPETLRRWATEVVVSSGSSFMLPGSCAASMPPEQPRQRHRILPCGLSTKKNAFAV